MLIVINFIMTWQQKRINKKDKMDKCNQSNKYLIVYLYLDYKRIIIISYSKISSPTLKISLLNKIYSKRRIYLFYIFRQSNQQSLINKIQVKTFRDIKFSNQADIVKQKLKSGLPIFKCIIYLRSQDQKLFQEHEGDEQPFLPDQKYIDMNKIQQDITNIRLFLQNTKPLRSYQFEFMDENTIQFKSRGFPTSYQINQRAQTLAKLYILNLYRDESRRMKQLNKLDQVELNHQRQIKKIKQQLQVQKLKQGQLIEQMDLIKQVHKILVLIQKKMNQMAYEQFSARKNGQKARQIKRSLQKLKQNLNQQPSAKIKLRMLISYKHKKGW